MARRYNTAAIQSGSAAAAAVGETPSWYSAWDAMTAGNFLRSFRINQTVAALALGEKLEIPAEGLSIVRSPTNSSLVAGIQITNAGTGYTSAPVVAFTGGGGSGAAGTAVVADGSVTGVIITNPGSGYTSTPTVSFTGGGGTAAAGTVERSGRETERSVLAGLIGETSADMYLQAHDGNPGSNGTNNVISGLARFVQASTNWTTAT